MAEHPPQNAASNLLADLSKMLAGPTSADGTVRRGNPGDNDPVLAMKPVPSPVYGTSPKGNGMAAASSSNMATPQPAPRRPSQGLDLSGSSTETVVAYALKALTEEFLGKVDLMTQSFQKMEDRLDKMEQKVEQHTMAVNALSASADKNFETLGSTVREIVRSVQLLKDKQELFDAQQEIARATVTAKGNEALAEPEPQEESGEATETSALSDLDSSEEEEEAPERARKKGKGKLRRNSLKKQRARAATAPEGAAAAPPPPHPQAMAPPPAGKPSFSPGSGFAPAAGSSMPPPQQPGFAPAVGSSMPPPQQPGFAPAAGSSMPPPQQPGFQAYGAPPPPPPRHQPAPQYHPGLPAPVLPPPPAYGAPPPPAARPPPGPPPPPRQDPSSGGQVSSSRVPIERVVEDVAAMGFAKHQVFLAVRRLTESGEAVDLNKVLDSLMRSGGESRPPQNYY
ncbi:DUF1421 domain-containing protein [Chloropicon roscoffensis]|uniref:DUF1421 domain-containing protein n=2 Tax=Chloropicon roscoffensis TaxID=1461544 RepID=A0AAX4P8V4_9CHLO